MCAKDLVHAWGRPRDLAPRPRRVLTTVARCRLSRNLRQGGRAPSPAEARAPRRLEDSRGCGRAPRLPGLRAGGRPAPAGPSQAVERSPPALDGVKSTVRIEIEMARIFVSYAHEDRDHVSRLIGELERAGHDVRLDEVFLRVGDPLSTKIRDELDKADFVCLVLSSSSVASTWVEHETAEVLCRELEKKRAQLLPCLIEMCELPPILSKLKRFERLYLNFSRNFGNAVKLLKDRINEGERPIFEQEQHLRLDVPVAGLDLYLTGEQWYWERNDDLKYFEMVDGYLLFGFRIEPWTYFKHFALCDDADASRVRGLLQSSDLWVSGAGDRDPGTKARRVWFTLPDYPVEGPDRNNRWPAE
jgi:TIR domain